MKVSDYSIAKYLILSAVKKNGCSFVDLNINFDNKFVGIKNNNICVGDPDNWGNALFNIISVYFDNFSSIMGEDISVYQNEKEENIVRFLLAKFVNKLTSGGTSESLFDKGSTIIRLYQYPVVWLLMKDIVCPAYQVSFKNVPFLFSETIHGDMAQFIDHEDYKLNGESFIEVNNFVKYHPIRDVFSFIATLDAYGWDSIDLIKEIMDSELSEKINSVIRLSYPDNREQNDFLFMLLTYCGIDNKIESVIAQKNASLNKTAQISSQVSNAFWYFGVLEKLLEPARGSDWSVYEGLMPWFWEIQNKIDKVRKERGRDGVTFEQLLRIKSDENSKRDNNTVIEKRLNISDNRIW